MKKATMLQRIVGLALIVLLCCVCGIALAADASYTVIIWVEKPDLVGDPGNPISDPNSIGNYIVFWEETRTARAGSTVALTQRGEGEFLRTSGGNRFAHFLSGESALVSEDGSTVVNAYYVRGVFTYVFNIQNYPNSELTVAGRLYTGTGTEQYTVQGKYEQHVDIPGLNNDMMPIGKDPNQPDAMCIGWAFDPRTGIGQALPFAEKVTDRMLPTDDMPYYNLTFEFSSLWYANAVEYTMAYWYEQLPDEESEPDLNRMTLGGKTFVNYPATDYPIVLPKGSTPRPGNSSGLTLVSSIEPEEDDGVVFQYIYERERYTISFNTNGAGSIPSESGIMYQQHLASFDPGWSESTVRMSGGESYRFDGWYDQYGRFIGYTLANTWMPPYDLNLSANWIKIE